MAATVSEPATPEQDSNSPAAAFLGAATFAAVAVTVGLWAGFAWFFIWLIWLVTLVIAFVLGAPLYLAASAVDRVNRRTAATGGFLVGAILPGLVAFPEGGVTSFRTVAAVMAFGACGAASGLVFLLMLHGSALGRRWRVKTIGLILAVSALSFAAAWKAQDRSCHNPVWYGRGIAPSATFIVGLPQKDWRLLASELQGFAAANHWSIRADATYTRDHPWFEMSACRADGTVIKLIRYSERPGLEVDVYQPQGGDNWKSPMGSLHARLRARWPLFIAYRDDLGKITRRIPEWTSERLSPAPSSAAR